jgi:hypothetical protein
VRSRFGRMGCGGRGGRGRRGRWLVTDGMGEEGQRDERDGKGERERATRAEIIQQHFILQRNNSITSSHSTVVDSCEPRIPLHSLLPSPPQSKHLGLPSPPVVIPHSTTSSHSQTPSKQAAIHVYH